jgi:sulfite reductase (ferredoxin)
MTRVGKKEIKTLVKDLTVVPQYFEDPSFYTDWADGREFTLGDMGVGECAGEVVSATDFGIAAAEGEVFEAQLFLDEGQGDGSARRAADKALSAMTMAAQALVKLHDPDVANDDAIVVEEFRRRFYDTQLFFDPFAAGKFAHMYFHAYEHRDEQPDLELAHRRVEEAQLFIEATHACYSRLMDSGQAGLGGGLGIGAAAAPSTPTSVA